MTMRVRSTLSGSVPSITAQRIIRRWPLDAHYCVCNTAYVMTGSHQGEIMFHQREYVSVTDTAKLIRADLKAAFAGVKFSVRCEKYAGGASIDVTWTDGPTTNAVDAIVGKYQSAKFDGMTDSTEWISHLVANPDGTLSTISYGSHYVHTNRNVSDALAERLLPQVVAVTGAGECCPGCIGSVRADQTGYMVDLDSGDDFWMPNRAACSPACATRFAARYLDAETLTPTPC